MGRRNLFAGCRNGSRAAQIVTESPARQRPTTETVDAAGEGALETSGALTKPGCFFAAAHAAGNPQQDIPQKPKLESLNSGIFNTRSGSSLCSA
jgi:hypothetical protein